MNTVERSKVERVAPVDFEEITAVWEASVRATHHFLQEPDILFYRHLILHEYLKAVELYCIRNSGGAILGFIGTSAQAIEMLFVSPEAMGKGIGKTLLLYATQVLGKRKVEVNEQNEQALKFYLRVGFTKTGRTETDSMGKPFPILQLELL